MPSGRIAYEGDYSETGLIALDWLDPDRLLAVTYQTDAVILDVPKGAEVSRGTVARQTLYGGVAGRSGRLGVFCASDGTVSVRELPSWNDVAVLRR